ncbi:universal stress protein [Thermococcus profundus]|uniref:Universal stress protein n=1 Tax=Thermococcus profundus TaxID=49899 RepID=A0A2Z2MFX8_THEPR|nr:universal stress protein [Thermococcus profundus]ASJ03625.1 universal stress protein [Thermococcus profundus]
MFGKILYPTDFSDVSLHALRNCISDVLRLGVRELHLVHVIDITALDFEAFSVQEIYREKISELAEELRKSAGGEVEIVTDVPIGIPSVEIAEYANRENVDLIIIPSAGENIWRRMFMGSTASNLARTSKKPVLILKYKEKGDGKFEPAFGPCGEIFKRPVIALDFSKCSLRIVREIKKFEEAVESGLLIHSVDYGKIDELEHNIELAKENLRKTSKAFSKPLEIEVTVGTASQAIIGMALAKKATLIVMGKKGRSFIKDLLLGSTAERVMRDAKMPVLLIPCE